MPDEKPNHIDEHSIPYMFGALTTQQSNLAMKFVDLSSDVNHALERLSKLPCNRHEERLNQVCTQVFGKETEQRQARLSIKAGVIIAVVTVIFSTVVSVGMTLLLALSRPALGG